MTRAVSRDLSLEFFGRMMTGINWGQIDPDVFQREVIELPAEEFKRRMTAFLKKGCRFNIKGPSVLVIDRTKPFNPSTFFSDGWAMGEQDDRALALTEIDFSKIHFESGLKEGELTIDGNEKLARVKQGNSIRLDAKIGQALYEEKGQMTLRFLHDTYDISWMEFAGTELRRPDGNSCFLCLERNDFGSWDWSYALIGGKRSAYGVSPLLASA